MVDSPSTPQFELRDYLTILLRRSWVVVLTLAVVVATALTLSYRKDKIYSSTAQVQVFNVGGSTPLATEIEIVRSQAVRDLVRQRLPGAGGVRPRQSGQLTSVVMAIDSRGTDPKLAADTANTYAQAYLDYKDNDSRTRAQQKVDNVSALLAEANKALKEVTDDYEAKSTEAERALAEGTSAVARPGEAARDVTARIAAAQTTYKVYKDVTLNPLNQRRSALQSQVDTYEANLREANATLLGIYSGRIITPATASSTPISPKPFSDGLTAAAGGLLLGLALAFLIEYLDDSLKRREQLDRAIGDIPVIGQIPTFNLKRPSALVTFADPQSAAAEAFRSLRTSVQFIGVQRQIRTIAVTSASPSEGKSTVIANLAVVLAGAGKKVVLMDCDLRRPTLHRFYGRSGMDPSVGITSVIIGEAPLAQAVQEVTGIARLRILPSGPIPPNPSELLSSQAFIRVLETLTADEDVVVLIDAPPVLPVTDGVVIAGIVDQMLLVVSAGISSRSKVKQAIERLARVGARPAGVVFNHSEEEVIEAYGYVEKQRSKAKRRRRRRDGSGATSLTRFDPSRPGTSTNGGERVAEPQR